MTDSLAPCRRCGEEVLPGALVCPGCGYDVDEHNQWRLYLGVAGTVLTLTVVLSPLGLALLWIANHHRRLAEGTVASRPPKPLPDHLMAVLGHHLTLKEAPHPSGEFTRSSSTERRFGRPPEL